MGIKYVAFDVETPNRCNDRISSIGISVIDDAGQIQTKEYLVNPECDFDTFNISLTGISPYTVRNAPTFPVIWEIIKPLLTQNTIVAHNARFDLSALSKTLTAYGIAVPSFKYVCTMQMARSIHLPVENYKLSTLCNYFGIPLNHHNAGSDSQACAIILMGFIQAGIDAQDYTDIYDRSLYAEHRPHAPWRSVRSESTIALNELNTILRAISCDGVLTVEEINFLVDWMNDNDALKGNFPYDRIYNKLAGVLEDGVITQQEHDDLIELFQTAENPVDAVSCDYTVF